MCIFIVPYLYLISLGQKKRHSISSIPHILLLPPGKPSHTPSPTFLQQVACGAVGSKRVLVVVLQGPAEEVPGSLKVLGGGGGKTRKFIKQKANNNKKKRGGGAGKSLLQHRIPC